MYRFPRQQLAMLLFLLSLAGVTLAQTWDMNSLCQTVQPMQRSMDGRIPLMLWNIPLPSNDDLITLRNNGTLRTEIDRLAARGIVPCVVMGWNWTQNGALAMGQTLTEASRPVHVLMPTPLGTTPSLNGRAGLYLNAPTVLSGSPWGALYWPAFPEYEADNWSGIATQLSNLAGVGATVNGVWFDYEDMPWEWNGAYTAQCKPPVNAYYPAGALDNWTNFRQYINDLRPTIFSEGMADHVHSVFPNAATGNYGVSASTTTYPRTDPNGTTYPPHGIGRLDASMPISYANTRHLPTYYPNPAELTQTKADVVYFTHMLRPLSNSLGARPTGKLDVAYVSGHVQDNSDPNYHYHLSRGLYCEFIRHALLRGSDGFFLFNLGYPGGSATPAESFNMIEDTRATYDEVLAYRTFLDTGEPMTFTSPNLNTAAPIWSGLRTPSCCLVRAFNLGSTQTAQVTIPAYPGVDVTVDAPPAGASYFIYPNGLVVTISEAPTISLTAPANWTTTVGDVTLTANASDPDGTIGKVEFVVDGIHLNTDTTSPYSYTWSPDTDGRHTVTAIAYDAGNMSTTSETITFTAWKTQDVGGVPIAGSAACDGTTFTLVGSGYIAPANTVDKIRFVYRQISGDCTIVARVASVQNVNICARGGVMIRNGLNGDAKMACLVTTPTTVYGMGFFTRSTDGGNPVESRVTGVQPPIWTKLVREGNSFSAYRSTDGITWTQVGSAVTIEMNSSVYVGLACCSNTGAATATSTLDNVAVWQSQDVGAVPIAGSAVDSGSTYSVTGAGYVAPANTSDKVHYLYREVTGDCTIVARVVSVQDVNICARGGVMIRNSLAGDAKMACIIATPQTTYGLGYFTRTTDGTGPTETRVSGITPPYWVKLVRQGANFTAYRSTNGTDWTQVGSAVTIPMNGTVYIGLCTCSNTGIALCTATYDGVTVTVP